MPEKAKNRVLGSQILRFFSATIITLFNSRSRYVASGFLLIPKFNVLILPGGGTGSFASVQRTKSIGEAEPNIFSSLLLIVASGTMSISLSSAYCTMIDANDQRSSVWTMPKKVALNRSINPVSVGCSKPSVIVSRWIFLRDRSQKQRILFQK